MDPTASGLVPKASGVRAVSRNVSARMGPLVTVSAGHATALQDMLVQHASRDAQLAGSVWTAARPAPVSMAQPVTTSPAGVSACQGSRVLAVASRVHWGGMARIVCTCVTVKTMEAVTVSPASAHVLLAGGDLNAKCHVIQEPMDLGVP